MITWSKDLRQVLPRAISKNLKKKRAQRDGSGLSQGLFEKANILPLDPEFVLSFATIGAFISAREFRTYTTSVEGTPFTLEKAKSLGVS